MTKARRVLTRPGRVPGFVFSLFLAAVSVAPAAEIRVLSDRPVPAPLVWAFDVRWESDSSVLIAAGKTSVLEVSIDASGQAPRQVTPRHDEPGGFWLSSLLASSPTHLVVGAPVFSYSWTSRTKLDQRVIDFDASVDIDVFNDRILILGALKDEVGSFSPDGAIAWFGAIEDGRAGLHPILYSIYGPGAKAMGECGIFGLGAARFFPDGSFVLIPGVEPGIFWYTKSGQLQRTWESSALGLEDVCKPFFGLTDQLAIDPHARNRWLNQRKVVDEILPLPNGPGIIIREMKDHEIRWRMAMLTADGKVSWLDLPLVGSSTYSHLKGDVRGHRIVFLVAEHGKEKPAAVPRIVLAELKP